jgi:hypothetical protein
MTRRQEPPELVIDGMGGRTRAILNTSAEIIYWETSGIMDRTMTTALTHRLNTGRILVLAKARQQAGMRHGCVPSTRRNAFALLSPALTLRAPAVAWHYYAPSPSPLLDSRVSNHVVGKSSFVAIRVSRTLRLSDKEVYRHPCCKECWLVVKGEW